METLLRSAKEGGATWKRKNEARRSRRPVGGHSRGPEMVISVEFKIEQIHKHVFEKVEKIGKVFRSSHSPAANPGLLRNTNIFAFTMLPVKDSGAKSEIN